MCRHYIGDEDCENNLSRGMVSTNIQPMDISGSKLELSERWRVWLRGFAYFAEDKAIFKTQRERGTNYFIELVLACRIS